jgi:DNA repair protein RadD
MPFQLDLLSYVLPAPKAPKLRPYQAEALDACLKALAQAQHPVLSLPTGSGKSHLIAALCEQLPGRILVATHRRELLEQDSAKLDEHLDGQAEDWGIYSAGLSRRDDASRIIFGGIGSIYRRMAQLQEAGAFAYIIVDEAHRIPHSSIDSMYGTVFRACPTAQRIGLTATPYRLDDGLLHEGDGAWFDAMPIHIGIRDLTPQYLAPLVGVTTAHDIDVSHVRTRMGEFVLGDLSQAACEEDAVKGAIDELIELATLRKKWLIFCVDVAHTTTVCYALKERDITAEMVTGDTEPDTRRDLLQGFRDGQFRAMVNCQVLTEGFDVADIDCIALLRPSQSKSLVVQCLGRGTRQAPAKDNCLVLDFSGNLERHTPLDELYETTKSPQRQESDAKKEAAKQRAEQQEHERLAKHQTLASLTDPMSGTKVIPTQRYRVLKMAFKVMPAKRFPGVSMLMVSYYVQGSSASRHITHFVCLEHQGWARQQAALWFLRRHRPVPTSAMAALRLAHGYPKPTAILVSHEGQWPRVLMEYFEEGI